MNRRFISAVKSVPSWIWTLTGFLFTTLAFCLFLGWSIGIALGINFFVHESGHALVCIFKKIPFKMYFTPLIGGVIIDNEYLRSRALEFSLCLAGPLFGFAFSLITALIYNSTGIPLFLNLTLIGVLTNIFQLLPIFPADGGRIVNSFLYSFNRRLGHSWQVITILLAIAAIYFHVYFFIFLLPLIVSNLNAEISNVSKISIPFWPRLIDIAISLFVLILSLFILLALVQLYREPLFDLFTIKPLIKLPF